MKSFPFIGPSYQYRSLAYDAQRSLNVYPIKSESGTSKEVSALVGTPGLGLFSTLPQLRIRGGHEVNGRCFFVAGLGLYELFGDGTYILRGSVTSSYAPVSMSNNGTQIVIVDGTTNGFILTLSSNVYAQITDPDFLGADTVDFVDGYFVFNKPNTGIYYISAINDGSDYDALDFATAEGQTDNLVAVKTVHNEVWLFGTQSVEVAYDSGSSPFPFSRIQGALMDYGCAAAFSVVKAANTVFWLGNDRQGIGTVWMASGYQPQRVSTEAVEIAIQGYSSISDAVAYTYQEDGHHFYVINFPVANTTWVYDIRMDAWHERSFLNTYTGINERHRGQCHVFCFGKHLIGDYANGNIYIQDLDTYTDDGNPIKRLRASPYLHDDLGYLYHYRLQLDMEHGVGLVSGSDADTDPEIILQWSDDGAITWSNEHKVKVGKIGERKTRAVWRQLGRSRNRIYRVIFTAACKVFWNAARLDADKGMN